MKYLIKKTAETVSISTRILRFYDKIGLLKPAYYADNCYYYYSEHELLTLQLTDKGVDISSAQTQAQKKQTEKWCNAVRDAIENNLKPSSKQAQALINEYYTTSVEPFCDMTPDEFVQLLTAEQDHPKSKVKYDAIHPEMAAFVLAAAKYYALRFKS